MCRILIVPRSCLLHARAVEYRRPSRTSKYPHRVPTLTHTSQLIHRKALQRTHAQTHAHPAATARARTHRLTEPRTPAPRRSRARTHTLTHKTQKHTDTEHTDTEHTGTDTKHEDAHKPERTTHTHAHPQATTHARTRTRTHTQARSRAHTHTHTHSPTHPPPHPHPHTHTHAHTHTHTRTHTDIRTRAFCAIALTRWRSRQRVPCNSSGAPIGGVVLEYASRVDGSPRGDDGIGSQELPSRDLPVFDDKGEHLRHARTQTASNWPFQVARPSLEHTSLRTTFPPTAAIEFAVVVAATAAPSPAALLAVMLCSV